MSSPLDLEQLASQDFEAVDSRAARLEEAWKSGVVPDLEDFLPPRDHPLRAAALLELIKTDLEGRWRHGQQTRLDYYLERFAELGDLTGLPVSLIYEEYRVRHRSGDKPALEAYKRRFPQQYRDLEQLVRKLEGQTSVQGRQVGDYMLLKRLGRGMFGEVWKATAPGGVEVAVKVLLRSLDHDDARRELESLEQIKNRRHPFLVQTLAYWPLEDRLYVVMELADGSLRDRLKDCLQAGLPGIPPGELCRYFGHAADALDYLHRQGVHHRDIKPDNLLLLQAYCKVADFGLAHLIENNRSVQLSGAAGTPAYMAPEMWANRISPHSDQYCLAASYVDLRLNRRLFPGRDQFQLMLQHANEVPDLEPLPRAEQEALLRALAKDPHQRFESCTAFVEALRRAFVVQPPAPPRPSVPHAGPYELVVPLAGGAGRGHVWEALGPDGCGAAVTLIQKLAFAAATKELADYAVLRALDHPRLVRLRACGAEHHGRALDPDGPPPADPAARVTLYLACDLVPESLAQVLARGSQRQEPGLPAPELLAYVGQAAEALDYLNERRHAANGRRVAVRHCAVRPDSLLLCGGQVQLGDFSLARVVEADCVDLPGDAADFDYHYCAPELLRNKPSVTAWSDQYALAVCYYHLRTGTLPFGEATSQFTITQRQLSGSLDFGLVPEGEQAVLRRATAKEPSQRFPSCLAMASGLRQAYDEQEKWARLATRSDDPLVDSVRPPAKDVDDSVGEVWGQSIVPPATESFSDSPHIEFVDDIEEVLAPPPPAERDTDADLQRTLSQVRPAPPGLPVQEAKDGAAPAGSFPTSDQPSDEACSTQEIRPQGRDPSTQNRLPALQTLPAKEDPAAEPKKAPTPSPTGRPINPAFEQSRLCRIAKKVVAAAMALPVAAGGGYWAYFHVVVPQRAKDPDLHAKAEKGPARTIEAISEQPGPGVVSSRELCDQGLQCLKRKQLEEAENHFTQVLEREPSDLSGPLAKEALLGRARALAGLGHWDKLREDLRRLEGVAEPSQQDWVAYLEALYSAEETAREPLKVLNKFVQLKGSTNALQELFGWERDLVEARTFQVTTNQELCALLSRTDTQELATNLVKGILTIDPGHPLALWRRAEIALETRSGGRQEAFEAAGEAHTDRLPKVGGFPDYVRGRWLSVEGKTGKAAESLDAAFAKECFAAAFKKTEEWQESALRRERAADTYVKAVGTGPAYTEKQFQWADRAVLLHPKPTVECRLALAEAGFVIDTTSGRAKAREQTGLLLQSPGKDKLGARAYRVLLIHAQTHEAGVALRSYEDVLDLYAHRGPAELKDLKAATLVERVVDPAIRAGQAWMDDQPNDRERPRRVAALWAFKGRLLWDRWYEEWPSPALPTSREAFEKAAELRLRSYDKPGAADNSNDRLLADYLVWQGYLWTQLAPEDAKQVKELASRAKRIAPAYSGSWFLDGLADHHAACFALNEPEAVLRYEAAALKALDGAVAKAGAEGPAPALRGLYYSTRSAANLLLGNYLYQKGPRQLHEFRPYFEAALADAQKVIDLKEPDFLWHAYYQKGNALEDLELYGGEAGKLREAVAAFAAAHDKDRFRALPEIGRGRAYFHLYKKEKARADLDKAEESLRFARTLAGADRALEAEALLWLGQVAFHQGKFNEALEHTAGGIKAAAKPSLGLGVLALEEGLSVARSLSGADRARADTLLAGLRVQCGELAKKDPGLRYAAARLEARSWLAEGNAAEARKACTRGLEVEPKPATPGYVQLLLLRTEVVLENDELKGSLSEAVQDAARAASLAEAGKMASPLRAVAFARHAWALKEQVAVTGKQPDAEEAIANYQKALTLDPKNPEAGNWRVEAAETIAFYRVFFKDKLTALELRDLKDQASNYLKEADNPRPSIEHQKRIPHIRDALKRV